ncbi:hypothetical protein K488DRAFT_62803 [Vararia minispora EC-137]|uniref:Uncharacterized protein n=1 Tax=Vararia minispora EC-137 TaxID=1314806 RepID=A0ACB8Q6I1_9AGAM|nr:hypothetical protein K488DRAFT_62803 [Vararia minispora EC-137]
MSTLLPSFLTQLPRSEEAESEKDVPADCTFEHTGALGPSHVYWWPAQEALAPPRTVLLFIPGNPGLAAFYLPFLSAIHSSNSKSLAILAHTHVGYWPSNPNSPGWPAEDHVGLTAQVAALVEVIDIVAAEYGSDTNIVLAGHSMGSWLATQVLKVRPEAIKSLLLLFPTISNIADTPNGVALSWLFRPYMPNLIANASRFTPWIPRIALAALFSSYPPPQLSVLRSLITSPRAVYASLLLARDEMRTIRDLDIPFLHTYADRLHFYYADEDRWVGREREKIINVLQGIQGDGPTVKVVHGPKDIPHAFCISEILLPVRSPF